MQRITLNQLRVRHFRILSAVDLSVGAGFNVFTGGNGSGKTSVLEAIHFLAVGRSFLNRHSHRLIQHDAKEMSVFATSANSSGSVAHRIGISATVDGEKACKLDGARQKTMVEVAKTLPVFVMEPNSQLLITGGPSERRRFLDRGLFHVEHEYQSLSARYRKSMEQLNRLLKTGAEKRLLTSWHQELADLGESIDRHRNTYVASLAIWIDKIADSLNLSVRPSLAYRRGWRGDVALFEALQLSRENDLRSGVVGQGPHRADLMIRIGSREARGLSSRGQLKKIAALLAISQLFDYRAQTGQTPIMLFDDLASELDANSQQLIFAALKESGAQLFTNSLDDQGFHTLYEQCDRLFHVEHGQVTQVI